MSEHLLLASLLESYFRRRLTKQRNATAATLASYRDALRMLILFAAARLQNSGTPKTGPGLVGQFWGLDSDRILKLVLRKIILSQEIQMPPGGRRPFKATGRGPALRSWDRPQLHD
jgi:hypothetical protein